MKKLIFIITFLTIILSVQLFIYPLNITSSVIPGRHITILSSFYFSLISAIIILIIPIITSLLLFKNGRAINLKIFIFHALISAILLFLLQISTSVINNQDLNNIEKSLTNIPAIILSILAIEQTLFGFYIFKKMH
ncbi:hypothetical protein SAMN05444363_1538 [Flavobacterium terrae]|uniref:Uncharacterized protein n=1 Tax=Flavobacterium terrae TaxID=415425 RepID=A0A1M6DMT5_9FLAO|nr:hypothetical protein SAMN05444363_1538 [Flavobacterium terrae]